MKHLLALCFLLLPIKGISQPIVKGSYLIAAICKDGIVIGEDTRMAIIPDSSAETLNRVWAYYDTIQKIYPIKKFVFSSVGPVVIKDKFIDSYIYEFEKYLPENTKAQAGADSLYRFLYLKYPTLIEDFLTLKTVIAGYENKIPNLWVSQNRKWNSINGDGYVDTFGDSSGFDKKYSFKYTCSQMAVIIENTIKTYTKKYHKEYTIGGPIMILKITPDNEFIWLKNKPNFKRWDKVIDFYLDYLAHKVRMRFPSKENKDFFNEAIHEWIKLLQ